MRLNASLAAIAGSLLVLLAGPARSEVNVHTGVKLSHDSNVNGSPTNKQDDFYLTGHVSGVYFTPINEDRTRYFIGQLGLSATKYNKYRSADSSSLLASAGLWQQLGETWSGQATARAFLRETRQDQRDSTGWGATAELKKQLDEKWWVKGIADFEDNSANASTFSYTGQTYGLGAGYMPRTSTFVNLGYNYTNRDFKGAVAFETRTHMLFAEITEKLRENLYLSVGYAHARNKSNFPGTNYSNNIWSIGLNASF